MIFFKHEVSNRELIGACLQAPWLPEPDKEIQQMMGSPDPALPLLATQANGMILLTFPGGNPP
jgi:hypothetical protein